jgi:hypothetical protein
MLMSGFKLPGGRALVVFEGAEKSKPDPLKPKGSATRRKR